MRIQFRFPEQKIVILAKWLPRGLAIASVLVTALVSSPPALAGSRATQNVFLIISDGFRWQELFRGAEEMLMNPENGGVKDTNALRQAFWRDSPEARREALLPFVWTEIAHH